MKAMILSWIAEPTAKVLIAFFWWLGDVLWDWTVTKGRGRAVRNIGLVKWTQQCEKVDRYEPTTERQKTWKENKMNMLRETGDLMAFAPYVTLSQRAERMVSGGGMHQP